MAMFQSQLDPAKRHPIGKTWREVGESIWDKAGQDSYSFKKAHVVAYVQLVVVHMNILEKGKYNVTCIWLQFYLWH